MILERFRLDGKVAIVTGASRGIGRGIALAFAEAGAKVVCAARSPETLDAAVEEVKALGSEGLGVPCDVNDAAQLDTVVARAVEVFGRIDVLVNNAGGTAPTPVLQLTDEAFERAFHFNVTSALNLSRQCIPHMLEVGGGAIVNISSAMGHMVDSGFVAYCSAKAALEHMTRTLAYEFAPHGIRANAIGVGSTKTDALMPFLDKLPDLRKQMEERTPLGRLGTTEDIACAALYLASPASAWVTGKVFDVDGGTVASNWPMRIPAL